MKKSPKKLRLGKSVVASLGKERMEQAGGGSRTTDLSRYYNVVTHQTIVCALNSDACQSMQLELRDTMLYCS